MVGPPRRSSRVSKASLQVRDQFRNTRNLLRQVFLRPDDFLSGGSGKRRAQGEPTAKARNGPKALPGSYVEVDEHNIAELAMDYKPRLYSVIAESAPIPDGFGPQDTHYVYVMKRLAQGGQGSVYLSDIQSRDFTSPPNIEIEKPLHAIKFIEAKGDGLPPEMDIFMKLSKRYPRFSQLEAFSENHPWHIVYYEYSNAGDLATLIAAFRQRGEIIPEAFIWHVFRHLVEAVHFMQNPPNDSGWTHPIWHLDIKAANVFLNWPDSKDHNPYPDVILGNFGLAVEALADRGYSDFVGTPSHAAPEQVQGHFSAKTDIWGLGSVLHEMVHHLPPIVDRDDLSNSSKITVDNHLHCRCVDENRAFDRGLATSDFYSAYKRESNPNTKRHAMECPPHYSALLSNALARTCENDAVQRAGIDELLGEVSRCEEQSRPFNRPLPMWFQLARFNELENGLKVRRVPARPAKSNAPPMQWKTLLSQGVSELIGFASKHDQLLHFQG